MEGAEIPEGEKAANGFLSLFRPSLGRVAKLAAVSLPLSSSTSLIHYQRNIHLSKTWAWDANTFKSLLDFALSSFTLVAVVCNQRVLSNSPPNQPNHTYAHTHVPPTNLHRGEDT